MEPSFLSPQMRTNLHLGIAYQWRNAAALAVPKNLGGASWGSTIEQCSAKRLL